MSDFCRDCRYDVTQKNGQDACPFNYLYWNFLIEHRQQLGSNPRLAQIYRSLDRLQRRQGGGDPPRRRALPRPLWNLAADAG